MKNIKKMLLGIACLIIAVMGMMLWFAGTVIGAVSFFVFLIAGIIVIIDGFLSVDEQKRDSNGVCGNGFFQNKVLTG